MQTVNLKKYYYPLFVKDTFVEVSDEVAEAMGDLTDTQARRIRARYVLGKKLTEIRRRRRRERLRGTADRQERLKADAEIF